MNRLIQFLLFLSAFVLSLPANAQLGTTYNEGPVTEVTYLKIELATLTSMSTGSIQLGSR